MKRTLLKWLSLLMLAPIAFFGLSIILGLVFAEPYQPSSQYAPNRGISSSFQLIDKIFFERFPMRQRLCFFGGSLLAIFPVALLCTASVPSLSRAARSRNKQRTSDLITAGADLNELDLLGRTPLHHAFVGGDVEIIRLLLRNNAKPPRFRSIWSIPFQKGNAEVVKALLAEELPINSEDDNALCELLRHPEDESRINIATLLLESGANPNQTIPTDYTVYERRPTHGTPFLAAIHANKSKFAELMLKYGADPTIKDGWGSDALQMAKEKSSKMQTLLEKNHRTESPPVGNR